MAHKNSMKNIHVLIFILFFIVSCTSTKQIANSDIADVSIAKIEKTVVQLVNEYREKQGLKPLKVIDAITEVSEQHSQNMGIKKVAFGHDGFNKRYEALKKSMPRVGGAAENVAFGNTSIQQIVEGWIKSPGHRKNMEGPFNTTGVGVYRNKKGLVYYTQIFINQTDK